MPYGRRVACPACGTPVEYSPQDAFRPFCSERCRLTDLGAWASESYRIPQRDLGHGDAAGSPDGGERGDE